MLRQRVEVETFVEVIKRYFFFICAYAKAFLREDHWNWMRPGECSEVLLSLVLLLYLTNNYEC